MTQELASSAVASLRFVALAWSTLAFGTFRRGTSEIQSIFTYPDSFARHGIMTLVVNNQIALGPESICGIDLARALPFTPVQLDLAASLRFFRVLEPDLKRKLKANPPSSLRLEASINYSCGWRAHELEQTGTGDLFVVGVCLCVQSRRSNSNGHRTQTL